MLVNPFKGTMWPKMYAYYLYFFTFKLIILTYFRNNQNISNCNNMTKIAILGKSQKTGILFQILPLTY